jgi:hypothetical protein
MSAILTASRNMNRTKERLGTPRNVPSLIGDQRCNNHPDHEPPDDVGETK